MFRNKINYSSILTETILLQATCLLEDVVKNAGNSNFYTNVLTTIVPRILGISNPYNVK